MRNRGGARGTVLLGTFCQVPAVASRGSHPSSRDGWRTAAYGPPGKTDGDSVLGEQNRQPHGASPPHSPAEVWPGCGIGGVLLGPGAPCHAVKVSMCV